MCTNPRLPRWLLLLVLLGPGPSVFAQLTLNEQLDLESAEEAFGVRVYPAVVVFSLDPRDLTPMWIPAARGDQRFHWPVADAGIAFGHEGFARVHALVRNRFGIFYAIIPRTQLPGAPEPVTYRFMVAGNLYSDPRNPELAEVDGGVLASRLLLPPVPQRLESPLLGELRADGTAEVTLLLSTAADVRSVRVAGSFNNWDPTGYVLSPDNQNPNIRRITMQLAPGRYFYQFVVDGQWIADPLNGAGATGPMLRPASVLEIPGDS